jgi:hypothetical protein
MNAPAGPAHAEETSVSTHTIADSQAAAQDDGGSQRPRVVVGVDGSDGSRPALIWALVEAARRGAQVDVVSAFPVDGFLLDAAPLGPPGQETDPADVRVRTAALVEAARRDSSVLAEPGSGGVPVTVVVTAGTPPHASSTRLTARICWWWAAAAAVRS